MNRKLKIKIWEKYGTQADFANFLKINESVVSRVVRERLELSDEQKLRWAEALDCSVSDIFPVKGI